MELRVPVGERPNEGVGDQLDGGLGGKHHPHFNVLVGEQGGILGAGGGVLRRLHSQNRLSRPDGGVGAHGLERVVVQGDDGLEGCRWSLLGLCAVL